MSINVIDTEQAPLAEVVARVREAAAERGVEVGPSELVGLLPEGAVADPALLGLDALTDAHVLERRIAQGYARHRVAGAQRVAAHTSAMEIAAARGTAEAAGADRPARRRGRRRWRERLPATARAERRLGVLGGPIEDIEAGARSCSGRWPRTGR